ncbi:M23 family metallopeptidase [Paenibacillus lemnae]|uniref:Peptidoglycan DD-metalloendopeptidase family protein n=1 Tax=Paenibacillus lemnae TaxID=1330551 RepID=A0A848M667_PAELE|nr:M23 family metallopeptidase [Paenibacillus lemnae]NMO95313.1 peptidoglycan DD-metalloendopeptidase family protein [Paenibacillus lemnae]
MDIRSSVRHRRQARIKELLDDKNREEVSELSWPETVPGSNKGPAHQPAAAALPESQMKPPEERDPEILWKQGYRSWYDSPTDHPKPPKTSFIGSMLKRCLVSGILFGAVWGVFKLEEPWAFRVQMFVLDGLSREMDFQAAQVWYEDHFGGAPSFIPIFGQDNPESTKVNGGISLIPPLNGSMVQPFAVDMNGVKLVPAEGSLYAREVKSVDSGRVLQVSTLSDGTLAVQIQHTNGKTALYSGLGETSLKVSSWVQGGEVVGILPSVSGSEQQPVLYFMLKEGDRPMDPAEVISF